MVADLDSGKPGAFRSTMPIGLGAGAAAALGKTAVARTRISAITASAAIPAHSVG